MRWIVGGHAVAKQAASASQIGRFETEYRRSADFIQSYIFPGGMLPSVTILKDQVAQAKLQFAGGGHVRS